jgi:hypothetical protein
MHQVIGGAEAAAPATADTTAPTSVIFCNSAACPTGLAPAGPTTIVLGGSDEVSGSGLDAVYYTLDGSEPTLLSPAYTAPFDVSANTTIKYAAYDNAGNREATQTQKVIYTDSLAPVTTVTCNGVPCGTWSHGTVSVALSAVDAGVGVESIRYRTDGGTPTQLSTAYTTPLSLTTDTTIKYRAYDTATNAETVKTLTLQFENVAPAATGTCNGVACSTGWYHSTVHVALSATDTGNSGVAGIHYTLDGSTPTASSPAYSAPFTVAATKTLKFVAIDNAGNVSAAKTKPVQIDAGKPVVAITAPANNAKVKGVVRVTIKASDAKSGIAKVVLLIDGKRTKATTSSPLSFSWHAGQAKAGKHTLTATATDKAGNVTTKSISVVR